MKGIFKDKKFIKTMLTLALPITLQSFITSSLNLVDNLMIGKLGEDAIASVGLANQYFFIFMLALTGINAGASVFMAQYWGKRDVKRIKGVLGLDISVGFIATIIFGIGALLFATPIMSILSNDPNVINLGSEYLRIVSISYIFTNLTMAFSSALRSTEQPKIPMYASLIGVLSNAFLNWVFIFGNLGMPKMGVSGAAIATTAARGIEMIFIINVTYIKKNKVAARIKELFDFDMEFVRRYFKTATPTIINELVWSFGMTAFSIAYAQIGTSAVATMQIATTINNMFMVLCIGLATAASIMVGNKIGADEGDVAVDYSKKIGILSPIIGLLIGIGIFTLARVIVAQFNVTPETYKDTLNVLYIMAIFCPIRFFNVVMIVGVFRGGGDTTYSMLVQAGTIWGYAVPVSLIGAVSLGLPITTVYFLICTEEVVKIVFELSRLRSGKWIKAVV
ncbi:MATE family efflux transporter [Clostridium baratii]|uniref:MATE family efflux transporter n=1 Tax=Clostridium baratii TaxID=1561 RepID=UPI001CAE459C|nr:MATE family efflux transporter [Clostridium baratii]STB71376.1 MATE efflux family protein [Clostridium baratii]